MWLWLLMLLAQSDRWAHSPTIALTLWTNAWAEQTGAPTSIGPVSPEEGHLLWTEGSAAFQEGRYQDAVNALQRLVDRYPGYPGYLEAHRYLGRSLMLLNRPAEAKKPLKAYVNATGDRALGLQTRLWLGEDELMLSEASQAYLTALAVEKETREHRPHYDPELYAQSQFLKTRALIALNQDRRAQRVLDSIALSPAVESNPMLKGGLARTQIELKLRSCAKLPPTGPHARAMTDGQARDQFSQRALCLQQALALFETAAESGDSQTATDAEHRISDAYRAYAVAIRNPPPPPRLRPTDRTLQQNNQYKAELVDRLERDRKQAVLDALSTLSNWHSKAQQEKTPVSASAESFYSQLAREIGGLPGAYQ